MSFLEKLRTIKRLHEKIIRGNTGTAKDLASTLQISRATLFRYLDYLAGLGAEISFSHSLNTFYYVKKFELNLERLIF